MPIVPRLRPTSLRPLQPALLRPRWVRWRASLCGLTLLLGLLLTLLASASQAATPMPPPADEALTVSYYEDAAGQLSAEQVLALPAAAWRQAGSTHASFGYTRSVYWFRVELASGASPGPHLLEIGSPVLDDIRLWWPGPGQPVGEPALRLGDKHPFADRPVRHPNFIVPVDLPAGTTRSLLARVQTTSALQFPLTLWSPEAFHAHSQDSMLLQGSYIGVMLGLLIYNLILLISVRERVYLLYVGWVASIGTFLVTLSGLSYEYLWPEATTWNDRSLVLLLGLTGTFGGAFASDFVKLSSGPRWRLHLLQTLVAANAAAAVGAFVLPYSTGIRVAIISAVMTIAVVTVFAVVRAREGFHPARIFILAFGAILGGGAVLALNKFGLIERSLFTEHAAQIGSAIEVLLISLGLAARLQEERRLRERAQDRALRVQREATETLESRVRDRTEALEQANRKLAQLSMTDGLTAIPNRRYLDDALQRELQAASQAGHPISVALVDVDHFKLFNDLHGHLAGDLCLQRVAQELQLQAKRSDDLVARLESWRRDRSPRARVMCPP